MNKNPFETLVEVIREQGSVKNPPSIMLGEVVSTTPFIAQAAGIPIYADDVLIAEYLIDNIVNGDKVAIMPTADKQIFIILCKVVKL